MQSPWGVDERSNRHDVVENTQGFERSMSAPPSGSNLFFGSRNEGNINTGADVSIRRFVLLHRGL